MEKEKKEKVVERKEEIFSFPFLATKEDDRSPVPHTYEVDVDRLRFDV